MRVSTWSCPPPAAICSEREHTEQRSRLRGTRAVAFARGARRARPAPRRASSDLGRVVEPAAGSPRRAGRGGARAAATGRRSSRAASRPDRRRACAAFQVAAAGESAYTSSPPFSDESHDARVGGEQEREHREREQAQLRQAAWSSPAPPFERRRPGSTAASAAQATSTHSTSAHGNCVWVTGVPPAARRRLHHRWRRRERAAEQRHVRGRRIEPDDADAERRRAGRRARSTRGVSGRVGRRSRSLIRTTVGRGPPDATASVCASVSPAEIFVPPLKDAVHGFGGSVGANPACGTWGRVNSRTSGVRSDAGVPCGSASYAWSEKRINPSLPLLRASPESVAPICE